MSRNNLTKFSAKTEPFVQHFLARIPPETASKFTNTQLTEFKRVLSSKITKYHAVDIRISIPFLKQQFYVVLLIGRKKRLNSRATKSIFTPVNNVGIIIIFLLLTVTLISLFEIVKKLPHKDYFNKIQALQQYLEK
ncbi:MULTISPECIES: hypothetical protein [Nostoc]|uniref:Uncharacterized protein n=1 Tax=Nostoc paludosum FACHB-159 TaxID=2692908 RepID=A0ABR8KDR9_9NOSO|nr:MULTISPECIES: hypothetical protein [Nostoc]MBD2680072.1 hypothetical protein [Nostoc sp. FACHB-857]MBD2736328.1 hypothetical protein [Nostoc paludosum FACHB-159]